jgi:hypothetical protein
MKTFSVDNPCPACGATGASVRYHKPGRCKTLPEANVEHMHRTCTACKFAWAEESLAHDDASLTIIKSTVTAGS